MGIAPGLMPAADRKASCAFRRQRRIVGYRGRPMTIPPVATLNGILHGFDRLYGIEFVELNETEARAQVVVRDELKQPAGLVHGGVYASLAESLASLATGMTVLDEGNMAMGLSNNTSFLRPILEGTVHAHAVRVHRGRTTWVWDVTFTDDNGRTCALTRMTIAVRPLQV
jgi:1,4-dihydroxy-2-naphthoyl-CoA hydrolase